MTSRRSTRCRGTFSPDSAAGGHRSGVVGRGPGRHHRPRPGLLAGGLPRAGAADLLHRPAGLDRTPARHEPPGHGRRPVAAAPGPDPGLRRCPQAQRPGGPGRRRSDHHRRPPRLRATTPSPSGWWPPAPTTTSTMTMAGSSGATSHVGQWAEDWTFQRCRLGDHATRRWHPVGQVPQLRGAPRPGPGRHLQVLQGAGELRRLRLGAGPDRPGAGLLLTDGRAGPSAWRARRRAEQAGRLAGRSPGCARGAGPGAEAPRRSPGCTWDAGPGARPDRFWYLLQPIAGFGTTIAGSFRAEPAPGRPPALDA